MTQGIDLAFSPAIKAAQTRKGSRHAYEGRSMGEVIDEGLRAFIESRDSAYLATASADGQPYVQHRGGPPGFLRVLDERTIGFVDFKGNRQYITTGNLAENPKAFLFLLDYAHRQRIKIWGRARVVEDDPALMALMPEGYRAKPEQVLVFEVLAWDANCPQHIPQKFDAADVAAALAACDERIAALEAELAGLRAAVREPEEPGRRCDAVGSTRGRNRRPALRAFPPEGRVRGREPRRYQPGHRAQQVQPLPPLPR
ncbi:MAG: pyridoxamine 5'-phosphate oxidase family protein [Geminicoccaceae bacterium]